MWMEASEWKNFNDIVKPLTAEMKQKQAAKSQAAQQQSKLATQQAMSQQNFVQKQQLQNQAAQDRIQKDLIVGAFRNSAMSEATEGEPAPEGVEGSEPTVE